MESQPTVPVASFSRTSFPRGPAECTCEDMLTFSFHRHISKEILSSVATLSKINDS